MNGGKDAIDRLGLGLMKPVTSMSSRNSTDDDTGGKRRLSASDGRGRPEDEEVFEEDESEQEGPDSRSKGRPPKIQISSGRRTSIRKRLFGRKSSSPTPSTIEEGRGSTNADLLSPPPRSRGRSFAASEAEGPVNDKTINRTRTSSPPRNTAIRFAENSASSSETAPGPGAYGANAPGFKRNPALALNRTTSVQSAGSAKGDGPNVSFKVPGSRP
jgi:hypothetical protein